MSTLTIPLPEHWPFIVLYQEQWEMARTVLETILEDMLPLNYWTVVSLAFTLYDHILTFHMEVCITVYLSQSLTYMVA